MDFITWWMILSIVYVCGFCTTGMLIRNHEKSTGLVWWFTLLSFCLVWPIIWVASFWKGFKEGGE
jgi:uncharacterized membrane protein YhdT